MKDREPIFKRPTSAHDEARREERLRALFAAADPPVKPSEALRQRVAAVTAPGALPSSRREGRSRSVSHRWRPLRLGLGLAGAAALAFAAVGVIPTLVAAQALRRMQAAISDARSMHEVAWYLRPDGSRTKRYESWYQGGRWRLEDLQRGCTDVFANGRLWSYDHRANTVCLRRTSGPFGYTPSGFSRAAMKRDFARWNWPYHVRLLGSARSGGRLARQVVIDHGDQPFRDLLLVDAATDLPMRSESQRQAEGRWITEAIAEFRFNEPLPESLFRPRFPSAAKQEDWDEDRETWRQRLSRGIARLWVARRLIVVRDLWVNANGDVFLLYTASKAPGGVYGDWQVDLADDRGGRYREAGGLEPTVNFGPRFKGSPPWTGFTFDGERLKGKWWAAIQAEHPWRPRRFALTFHVVPIDHPKLPRRPDGRVLGEAEYTVRGSFRLPVQQAGSALVPPYMPFMAALMDDDQIRRHEAEARASFYRQVNDPMQIGDLGRGGRHPGDFAKALACYQEIVRLEEDQARRSGETPHDPGVWTNIGKVLYRLDRYSEARAAWERAIRESVSNDWSRQEPQGLVKGIDSVTAWTPGQPAPHAFGTDLAGRRHSVEEYRDRVLLIALWSRFAHELPQIKALNDRFPPAEFAVLGVCIDINRRDLMQVVQAQRLPWPNLYDDRQYESEVGARFGYSWDLTRLPRTILVDRQGIVRAVDLHGAALERAVADLVARR